MRYVLAFVVIAGTAGCSFLLDRINLLQDNQAERVLRSMRANPDLVR